MEFAIKKLDEISDIIRDNAATSLAETYQSNQLDKFVTINQIEDLIIEHSLGTDDEGQYIINMDVFADIFDSVRNMIYQSALSKLAASGTIESAWDSEKDKMVFWMDSKASGVVDLTDPPDYNIEDL
tara:strand:- start:1710 stop:2090 length:381 start_codon:yes stop_codon:yes gene_type:complete